MTFSNESGIKAIFPHRLSCLRQRGLASFDMYLCILDRDSVILGHRHFRVNVLFACCGLIAGNPS